MSVLFRAVAYGAPGAQIALMTCHVIWTGGTMLWSFADRVNAAGSSFQGETRPDVGEGCVSTSRSLSPHPREGRPARGDYLHLPMGDVCVLGAVRLGSPCTQSSDLDRSLGAEDRYLMRWIVFAVGMGCQCDLGWA